MTEKKKFEKPEIRVIELKLQPQLLAGSQLDGQLSNPEDYNLENDPFNF